MMKKDYVTPDLIYYSTSDIIVTSTPFGEYELENLNDDITEDIF